MSVLTAGLTEGSSAVQSCVNCRLQGVMDAGVIWRVCVGVCVRVRVLVGTETDSTEYIATVDEIFAPC